MDSAGLRERLQKPDATASTEKTPSKPHSDNRTKPSAFSQYARMFLFISWFVICCLTTFATQLLGSWLYFVNKDYYYAYMALTKQSFGILIVSGTQWFSPTAVRVSGDKSVTGQLKLTKDGRLETNFPERLIMIANHQLYPEWAYLWWIAYTSRMHGHIFIILKESLKWVPVIGQGMMFYGFIFMARKWSTDQSRMAHRLKKLASRHDGPLSGSQNLDPMWLLIFPEGTNLSGNTRKGSARWAEKTGTPDLKHQLLPRTTGLQFALAQLKGSVDWIYDCTLAYEGIPEGGYAQDFYTLRSTYLEGRPPRVNMYWRRFPMSSIPIDDHKAFEDWLMNTWRDKEAIMEYFHKHGRFPASNEGESSTKLANGDISKSPASNGYIETEVRMGHWIEVGQVFVVLGAVALLVNVALKSIHLITRGTLG